MICQKTFLLSVSAPVEEDMPLDQAVYVPQVGARAPFIAAVRGGYLYKLDPMTGTRNALSRFAPTVIANSCMVYDVVTDRIFVACWNDGSEWFGSDTSPGKRIFKLNPSTLALEQEWYQYPFYHVPAGGGGSIGDLEPMATEEGVWDMVVESGVIYGMAVLNLNGHSFTFQLNTTTGIFHGFSPNFTTYPVRSSCLPVGVNLLVSNPGFADMAIYEPNGFAHIFDSGYFLNGPSYSVSGFCAAGSNFYCVDRSKFIYKLSADLSTNSSVAISLSDTGALRCRYNTTDGFVYVPAPTLNEVIVYDPATDSVVATKTGFDSPFDVVFTPTKKFAVQQGLVGLKEIV